MFYKANNFKIFFLLLIFYSCNSDLKKEKKESKKSEKELSFEKKYEGWNGTWTYENQGVLYTLSILRTEQNDWKFHLYVTGNQTFYEIDGFALLDKNSIKFYYEKTLDGSFLLEKSIILDEPILTMNHDNNLFKCKWNQLNFYQNKTDCFQRAYQNEVLSP
jgi:hypothetical protein